MLIRDWADLETIGTRIKHLERMRCNVMEIENSSEIVRKTVEVLGAPTDRKIGALRPIKSAAK